MKTKPSRAKPNVASPAKWLAARRTLLREEKQLMRLHDRLNARRRQLPWVKVGKNYTFASPCGRVSLADLFASRSQLIVQHFMLGPGWEEGCKSCSFMTDHFNPAVAHLAARDVSFAAVSRAPLADILPFKKRMGWDISWVSSHGTDFNFDFHVSFRPLELKSGKVFYNYARRPLPVEEAPGISVFARDAAGMIYHTYSTYGRGVEVIMGTYHLLDLVPKGRDEGEHGMQWIRHHDRYSNASQAD
ncbi:MAG: thioredoxin family protein [Verrucomicrobiota bacterium]